MTNLTDHEYDEIVTSINEGSYFLGVDRAIARKLWMTIPNSVFEQEMGEVPYVQKMIILGAYIISYVSFLVSVILSIMAFQWWSLLIIPASFVGFSFYMSMSSMPMEFFSPQRVIIGFLFLASLVLLVYKSDELIVQYFFSFLLSLWCTCLYYDASTSLLKSLALSNKKVFEFFREHLHVKRGGM